MVFRAVRTLYPALILASLCTVPVCGETLRIRIFSKYQLKSIQISSETSFELNGQTLKGPVEIKRFGKKVQFLNAAARGAVAKISIKSRAPLRISAKNIPKARMFEGPVVITVQNGLLRIFNEIPLESYVTRVMSPEARDLRQPEALRAMAIVSRSYARSEKGRHKTEGFDFCDLTHCQVYHGVDKDSEGMKRYVEETAGQYVLFEGKIAHTYYHACCGGSTADARDVWDPVSKPYLKATSDKTSDGFFCEHARNFRWDAKLTAREIQKAGRRGGWLKDGESVTKVEVLERDSTGRVKKMRLKTSQRSVTISGNNLYRHVGQALGWNHIKSTWFDVVPCRTKAAGFCFEGKGFGHGVGFCQSGAEGMAKKGFDHRAILKHYFSKTSVGEKNP